MDEKFSFLVESSANLEILNMPKFRSKTLVFLPI